MSRGADVVRSVGVGLLVVLLPGVWVATSPDPAADRVRALAGFAPSEEGDGYTFLQRQPNDGPVTGWDPCTPIEYVVDPTGAPDDWFELIERATGRLEAASGIGFVFTGTVEDRGFKRRPSPTGDHPPVLIAWSDAEEHPRLAGDVTGLGGATAIGPPERRRYVTGAVIIDTEDVTPVFPRLPEALMVHELAHVLGLGHTVDPHQMMHGSGVGVTGVDELGAGDLEGLRRLGDLPCE